MAPRDALHLVDYWVDWAFRAFIAVMWIAAAVAVALLVTAAVGGW